MYILYTCIYYSTYLYMYIYTVTVLNSDRNVIPVGKSVWTSLLTQHLYSREIIIFNEFSEGLTIPI